MTGVLRALEALEKMAREQVGTFVLRGAYSLLTSSLVAGAPFARVPLVEELRPGALGPRAVEVWEFLAEPASVGQWGGRGWRYDALAARKVG